MHKKTGWKFQPVFFMHFRLHLLSSLWHSLCLKGVMKTNYLFLFAIVLLAACSDSNTANNAEAPATVAPAPVAPPAETPTTKHVEVEKKEKVKPAADTAKTTIRLEKTGGSIHTKKGTGVSVGEKGVKIGSRDVDIDINTKE
jgi:hypothetical protein